MDGMYPSISVLQLVVNINTVVYFTPSLVISGMGD